MLGTISEAFGDIVRRLQRLEQLPFNPYSPDADMFDHFAGDGTIDSRWTTTLVLTGTISLPTGVTPTYARLSTGATASSEATLNWGPVTTGRYPLVGMAKGVDMRWRARAPLGVNTTTFLEGILTNSANSRLHALGVVGSASVAFFTARTLGSTGTTTSVTTVAVDTAWHDWRIQTMPDRARFFIDNALVAEHTLTADTLQTDALAPWLRALNGATAGDRRLEVDIFWVRESR